MLSTKGWLKAWIYLGFISGWTSGARPQFDTSTNMGLVLVPADAEVDSVIFRLRATDQDADFPLIFDITAAVQPIVRIENLPCTLYNKVCQANVILTRRLVPGRLHDFAVRVRDSKGDLNTMQATISVTNATTPRDMIFPHVPSIIMVPEDTKPGKELDYLLVRANPWHGKPVYIELWQPKELFTIRQRQTPTQTRGVITLIGELDFETQSMYTLTMYATDPYTEAGKDTRNIAGVHVVVIVQDVQDVPPVFTIAPPLTRVNNSAKPGDMIIRVHAEDGDKGTPREVAYGLVSEGNPFTPFFNISESTGEIILARPLEELTQITHVGSPIVLTVVAEEVRRSRDEPPAQATVVEIGLLLGEPGNSPPYFESSSYMAWMDENAAPGTVVIFDKPDLAVVRDEDIGKTGVFTLKLGNNNGTFEVTPSVAERVANFVVTVRDNTLMDYEVWKTLEFMIIAQEVGPATNLSASVPVTIVLRDVNDNPPEFEKDMYEVTIAENVSPGTRVVQVHASDQDTGLSGRVKYTRIIGEGSESLTLDSESGLIVVAKNSPGLDREVTASLQLSVEARDENGRGLRSTVPLIVNLLDINDNAPIFEESVYQFVLNSEQTNFTSPAFIKALDADAEPPNNEVRYELVHGNYGNKFHLNEVTGELILREPLNKSRKRRNNPYVNFATRFRSDFLQTLNTFQKLGVATDKPLRIWKNRKKRTAEDVLYTLTVRAYDAGVPHRSSTAKIEIITAAPMGAHTLMLVVPAEHLDPIRTTEILAAITGGRVTIQEIRPYDPPSKPGEGTPQGRMSLVVARVEPTMSGTFLVDFEKIHKNLLANGMGIVPLSNSNTNSVNVTPGSFTGVNTIRSTSETLAENGSVGGNAIGGAINGGTENGKNGAAGSSSIADPGRPTVENSDGTMGGTADNSGTKGGNAGAPGGESVANGEGNSAGGTDSGSDGTSDSGGRATVGGSGVGMPGGTGGGTTEGKVQSNEGTIGGAVVVSGGNVPSAENPGGVGIGTNHRTEVNVQENFNKINKTISGSENEYIVYKAENKLLLWLLILLGLLMLLGLLALILCCICPGCPFYMAPRKRRVHSFESVNHADSRPKRHLRRKQLDPVKAEWSGKKQAWSADPMRRNWQFNRRNTKNRGLASLPGDVAGVDTPQRPALQPRDGPEFWGVQYATQKPEKDRIYVEDVEAGRTYDTDIDSLRRHEMERGSDGLRHSYHLTDEALLLPREQHFYRDGNAEVLRLVTGGQVQSKDVSIQAQRPTTLVVDQQALHYRNDGKDILLRRFIEDQNIRQHQDLHSSIQEISVDGLELRRQGGDQFLEKHEVVIMPQNLELDQRHRREERAQGSQRLIIDHGDTDHDEELRMQNQRFETKVADLRQQRKIAAAMLVGTAASKATEKPMSSMRTVNIEHNTPTLNIPTYTIHDLELAKQNALLTQLLMDRDVRHLGVPGLDPGSYLETQSLPGQVATATQTDRTTATQTENRSRSDNEESEEEIRSRKKSKMKKRFGNELRRSRSLWLKSPIEEERSFSGTRTSLLRRKAKEAREGRRGTLEPEVLREISDSLDEQTSTPSLEETQTVDRQLAGAEKAECHSEEICNVDDTVETELVKVQHRSSPDTSKDKYHKRSHAKAVVSEALQALPKLEDGSRNQSASGRSKTKPQKTKIKSGDAKKISSMDSDNKKESDGSSSKQRSTESQSNNSGTEKKENDDKKKKTSKLVSKIGLLKSSSEKSSKKSKSRETEEAPTTKKRTMMRQQKVKKISTESSEFEEILVKPKPVSLKAKLSKQAESTSGSNSRQDTAQAKKTSTLSNDPKIQSSGTDRDRQSKRYKKQSDSNSSSATAEKESTPNESTNITQSPIDNAKKHIGNGKRAINSATVDAQNLSKTQPAKEVMKFPHSLPLIGQNPENNGAQIEYDSTDMQRPATEVVSVEPRGELSRLELEALKSGTALINDRPKPEIDNDLVISAQTAEDSGTFSPEVNSEGSNVLKLMGITPVEHRSKPNTYDKQEMSEQASERTEGTPTKVDSGESENVEPSTASVGDQLKFERTSTKVDSAESETSNFSIAATKNQSESKTNDEPKTSAKASEGCEKISSKVDTELVKSGESSLAKEKEVVSESETVLRTGTKIPERLEQSRTPESGENDSPTAEANNTEASKIAEKISDYPHPAAPTSVSGKSAGDRPILFVPNETDIHSKEMDKTGENVPGEHGTVDPEVSEFSSAEKPLESDVNRIQSTIETINDNSGEIPSKSNLEEVGRSAEKIANESQPELSAKEVTLAFLQSEAMQSSHDLTVPPEMEAKDQLASSRMAEVSQKKIPEQSSSDSPELVRENSGDVQTGLTQTTVGNIELSTWGVSRNNDVTSPVKNSSGHADSFKIIGQLEEAQDTTVSMMPKSLKVEELSDKIRVKSDSPQKQSRNESPNDNKNERGELTPAENTGVDNLEGSKRPMAKSPIPQYESIVQSEIETRSMVGDKEKERAEDDHRNLSRGAVMENGEKKSPAKKSDHTSEDDDHEKMGSPSFYILSSTSSTEDFSPDQVNQEMPQAQTQPDQRLSERAVTLITNFSDSPAIRKLRDRHSVKQRSHDEQDNPIASRTQSVADMPSDGWNTQQIQIANLSSDSHDNAEPYQTPRHRSKNRTTIENGTASTGKPEVDSQLSSQAATLQPDRIPRLKEIAVGIDTSDKRPAPGPLATEIREDHLTPKLIAEEAIRTGLREVIDSDGLRRESSSQTSSKSSPENKNQPDETSKRKRVKPKSDNDSVSNEKMEKIREVNKSARPRTEPEEGNLREADKHHGRPRIQRSKTSDSRSIKPPEITLRDSRQAGPMRRSKLSERTSQAKQNPEEIKSQDSPQAKQDERGTPKKGYMSRYKQKREEMEKRRRELKEAAADELRPRWQRKPHVIPPQRVSGKELLKEDKPNASKTPGGTTPRTRRRIKPLANAESEQLRAMVKEGRKLRRAEGGDSDDPTVQIFANEPPAEITASSQPGMQRPSYVYENIPPPFYLHPPPPPQSTPQISPLHVGPVDHRRADDDLDSGIAVSLQGGTKLRHQQLLEKKSVFDIAYSDAAPSQLRTDSTTPPS